MFFCVCYVLWFVRCWCLLVIVLSLAVCWLLCVIVACCLSLLLLFVVVVRCLLLAVGRGSPCVVRCWLLAVCCVLLVVSCLLMCVCCFLFVASCLVVVVCCWLFGVIFALRFGVVRRLDVARCLLFVVWSSFVVLVVLLVVGWLFCFVVCLL